MLRSIVGVACAVACVLLMSSASLVSGEGVTISPKHWCMSCMSVVELFFTKTMERAEGLRKRDGANTNVQGTELMNAICTYPEWKHYHENLYWGCAKIQAEFQGDVFGTFNGKHTFGDDEEIYSHKKRVCSNIGACKPMGMVASTLQEKTECGACRAVAMDIEYLLDRERDYKDKKRMKALVGTICDDLGMRHPQSDKAFIEDYCDEIMEEIGVGNIAGTFKLRKGMETSMFKLTQTWADKMCSDMSSYCPKPAGVEDDGVAPAAGSEGSDEEL